MKFKPKILVVFLLFGLALAFLLQGKANNPASAAPIEQTPLPEIEIEPELLNQLMTVDRDRMGDVGYLIYFRERPDLSPAYDMEWEERGHFVVAALHQAAESAQKDVRTYLDSQGVSYQSYWIDNIILVKTGASLATFNGLLQYAEISALRTRRQPMFYEPELNERVRDNGISTVGSNISHVAADQVWAMGYTGQGIVVANIDTGVLYTHDLLVEKYRGNMGVAFDHNYNWWDPALGGQNLEPGDWHNHGSHTMGTILGDDGAANQTGMAPGATWMACKAFQDSSTDDELLECGQFMLEPYGLEGPADRDQPPDSNMRPHIINNSWGDCSRSLDPWFKGIISSWLAAGIYPVFSNGNSSNCNYTSPPGLNTVGNPARYGNVTGVGSTGNNNGIYATHSNWGPTDDPDLINPAGYPNLKPQVVAPGVSIRSALKTSNSTYGTMSGTSMSAPHVTGLVALIWGAAPCLIGDYANTERIIQETATPINYPTGNGGEGPGNIPNYATGWGEINALAAVLAALEFCSIDVTPETQALCVPGDVLYDVRVGESFSEPVSLSVVDLPTGASASLSLNPVDPVNTSVLTVSLTGAVASGSYDFTVVGTNPSKVFSDTVSLEVFAATPLSAALLAPLDGAIAQSVRPDFIWAAVPQAVNYYFEIATDAAFSNPVYSTTVTATAHSLTLPLLYETQYFWRIQAQNICGTGPASDIFEFTTKIAPEILLVDDDDNDPDVLPYYTAALSSLSYAYEIWDTQNSDTEPDADHLSNFEIVIWFTGEEWDGKTGPGSAAETSLGAWLDTGKCLLISSQDYHYAREFTPFMDTYLGLATVTDDVWQTTVTGSGFRFSGLGPYSLRYPYSNWSDRLAVDADAQISFSGNAGNAAVNKNSGTYKTSFWAFPFEAIPTASDRETALQAFIDWCGPLILFFPLIFR